MRLPQLTENATVLLPGVNGNKTYCGKFGPAFFSVTVRTTSGQAGGEAAVKQSAGSSFDPRGDGQSAGLVNQEHQDASTAG